MANTEFLKVINKYTDTEGSLYINRIDAAALRAQLEQAIREEAAKKRGTGSKAAILKRMFKSYNSFCENRHFELSEGAEYKYLLTNGVYGFYSNDFYGYEEKTGSADLANRILTGKAAAQHEIEIDLADLKAFLQIAKAEAGRRAVMKPYVIEYGDGEKIGFNPSYLMDCLNFVKANKINIVNPNSAAFIRGAEELAIICPVFLPKEEAQHDR